MVDELLEPPFIEDIVSAGGTAEQGFIVPTEPGGNVVNWCELISNTR
jgi:hypothetical protein